ncbi:glycosyltransferase [Maridesulfovibrio zosterae]|uniref:glycosyltransferase n=1 Tax=Maridesulfovibrio zosterae TaxID=82171 RepID=UPI000422D472|nr:glycosyltransferase [Maridesulfovibrio zosterae]
MQILHISKYAHPERGGIETFVKDLSSAQIKRGHEVRILCHQQKTSCKTAITKNNGITITRVRVNCNMAFAPVSFSFASHLRKEISSSPPQVIHLHLPNPAVLFYRSIPDDIPCVVHWHADVHGTPNPCIRALYPFYRFFEQKCLAKADHIIATSPPYLSSSFSLAAWRQKSSVVPLGLDTDRYPSCTQEKSNPPLVLSVGRFAYYKGFEYLVRAAALIPEAKFIIAGSGPEHSRISKEVEKLGLSERVYLPGHITDQELFSLMQKASVFCLPSIDRAEAFGMVLLEAMRYGVPIVSTEISGSGTGWVNEHGGTGIVVPPADSQALKIAIKTIISNPQQAQRYGQAGKAKLENNFKIDQISSQIDDIYQSAITSKHR